jgi:inositol-phosphate phosphatase/L-galactose 1-phosphate phosphatase/histidinol-phosphatase
MPSRCPTEFINFAISLADAGGTVIRRYFRAPLAVEAKADATPVTIADREAEAAMRALIQTRFPDHGIIGEELGSVRGQAADTWVLDPIDGTKSFITGKPIFGTLIGLLREGQPILGVIDQPILGERWIGAAGHATTFNGEIVSTRSCPGLGEAILNATTPDMFNASERAAFERVAARARHTVYGGDCYAYGLTASGHIDLVIEAGLAIHDYCALGPVVAGAGGVMTDWQGKALHAGSDGRVVAAGDAVVHRAALALLADGPPWD